MGRKASKKPLLAGAIGGETHAPVLAGVPMPVSGVLKLSPGDLPTSAPWSDTNRVNGFANPSLKHNLGPWFYPAPSLYNYGFDEHGPGNFSDEQLEEILINYLDCIYNEVISRLVSFGYDAALALGAVLCNGHYYGAVEALPNIMQNALEYLNKVAVNTADDWKAPAGTFSDLRHLEEYSLAVMVCLIQEIRAELSRGEAMWCLLMGALRVRLASSFKFPSLPGNLQAAGNAGRQRQHEVEVEENYLVQFVLERLEAMRIEDKEREDKEVQDQKTEMIMDLIRLVLKREDQIKAAKQWAKQKVMEAVQMFGSNTQELMVLRVEREENQRALNEMQVLVDSTMKRRAEMESVLKKASKHVDRVSAFVKELETENSDIRAEIEASMVSESLSLTACSELITGETTFLKKLVACAKENNNMQEEITEKMKNIVPVQQQLAEVQEATKQAEI